MSDTALQELIDERDIRRVLLTYARGIDRMDVDLVRSVYWPEATDSHGVFKGTREEFLEWVFPLLEKQTMTMHHLANILIDLEGDSAGVETYGVAYHSGKPEGDLRFNYAAGFRYVDRFERRDGEWRIADRITVIEWVTPWQAHLQRAKVFGALAHRDRTDPVYDVRPDA
jgi:hypothetical protein